ncbi:MAG TPA: 2-oxoglutarate dehydrogenase, E2 component, dihydrolipoamide succinyltransferase [Mycobacteriales bacterium]|nr:2-oxoglutarate dehydrogenase, E2 component, dihydrolipoamide succinyltransferase [Mycobacteriales bacterium]
MAVSVTMPRLGESVSEGTITRWLKKEGEHVEADEPLLEVSTDKVDTEIPSPASGVLTAIKVAEDETVEIGAELAVIDETGGAETTQGTVDVTAQEQSRQAGAPAPAPQQQPEQAAEEQAPPAEPVPQQPAAQQAPPPPPQQAPPPPPQQAPPAPPQQAPPAVAQQPAQQAPPPASDGQASDAAYVTPLVRKLAAEHGVDLEQIQGTGVGGRIRKQDVLDAARTGGAAPTNAQAPAAQAAPPQQPAAPSQPAAARPAGAPPAQRPAAVGPTPARGHTETLSRLRRVIAERMTESLQTSAQLTTVVEVDVTRIARLIDVARPDFEAREGVKLRYLPFFALATCEALRAHPAVNASIDTDAGTVTYHDSVHLGVAVDTDRGLLVPVIRDAGDLNIAGLARKIADLAERTRGNNVSPDELGGGTFTLTNTGSRGALFDTPIINQPQVGILGTGAVVKRPVVVEDPELGEVITIRCVMYLALTYDHRLVDGADAARFLGTVKERLEAGDFAADLGL